MRHRRLSVALAMIVPALSATASPVDDVRNADMVNFTSLFLNYTVTGATTLEDSIAAENLVNCVPKEPGTLNLEIDLADLGAPFSAPITLIGTAEGDIITWFGQTDVNQCVQIATKDLTVNAQVRQVTVSLAAQASATGPSPKPTCAEIFNVNLISVPDDDLNFVTFTAFVECIPLPFFQINFATHDLAFSAQSGAAPTPDLNGDGLVNGADLAALLSQWGGDGPADLTGDGVVNGADLANLLSNWGPVGD